MYMRRISHICATRRRVFPIVPVNQVDYTVDDLVRSELLLRKHAGICAQTRKKKDILGYISNLRLDKNDCIRPYDIEPHTDYLALCGDNGDPFKYHYRELLIYASMNFQHTVFIAGDREYDRVTDPTVVVDRLNEISHDLPNVEFLNRDTANIAGYTVIGATLWNNGACNNNDGRMAKRKYITNGMNCRDVDWLTHIINATTAEKIVLTHNAPTFLSHQLNDTNIYAWICGSSRGITDSMYCMTNTYDANRKVMPVLAQLDI